MGEFIQHASRKEIIKLLDNMLADSQAKRLQDHIASCQFCAELYQNLQEEHGIHFEKSEVRISRKVAETAQKIYAGKLDDLYQKTNVLQPGLIIELKPLVLENVPKRPLLAADSQKEHAPEIEHFATAYSEEPEALVRLMRNNSLKKNFIQVVSADPKLFQNVLVESAELGCSVVTNDSGEADLPDVDLKNLSTARWSIRMPEAFFTLEPVEFDSDSMRGASEKILETQHGDKLRILLKSESGGVRIQIELLELHGNRDFESTRLAITLDNVTQLYQMSDRGAVIIQAGKSFRKLSIQVHN